jgi:hypothetical protein
LSVFSFRGPQRDHATGFVLAGSDVGVEPFGRGGEILLGDDVVPIECRARPMPRHPHGDHLGDASPDHVADRAAAQIVEDQPGEAGGRAGAVPDLFEIAEPAAVPMSWA